MAFEVTHMFAALDGKVYCTCGFHWDLFSGNSQTLLKHALNHNVGSRTMQEIVGHTLSEALS